MRTENLEEVLLPDIKQMNIEAAIENCGGRENLIEVLKTVVESGPQRIHELQSLYDMKALGSYRIEAHALKSECASIGCSELRELAFELEKSAKEGNIAFIDANHDNMVRSYMELVGELQQFFDSTEPDADTPRRSIDRSSLMGILNETETALSDYEDTAAEERLRYLLLCDIPEELESSVRRSLRLLELFSFDDACAVVRSMKQMVCKSA